MKRSRQPVIILPILAVVLMTAPQPVEAGGSFGVHVGSSGFGVSVGFGDWGVYTSSWSDPYWSLNFDAALAGYGEWAWVGGLGRVWRPWVSAGWRPYTYGRWVRTGAGWTWVAYEPWGYIPHHYGSWAYSRLGWVWRPGYAYAGANVVWVRAGAYLGWYARPPYGWSHAAHGYRHGYRDGYRNGYDHGYDNGWHDARYATYVGWGDLGSEDIAHHAVSHSMAARSRVVDHASAPTFDEVGRHGGRPVAETRLSRRTVSMGGREITIARPEGVARSIEHHAADAVGEALAPAAIERRQPLARVKLSPFPARPMPPICGNGRSLHPRPASDSPPKPRPPHAANPGPRHAPRGSGLKCRMEPRFVHPPVRPSLTRVQIATVRPNRGPWLPPAAAARRQPPPAGGAANGAGRQPQIGEPMTLLVPRQLDLTLQSRTAVILRTPGQPGLGNPAAQESANT